MLQIGLADSGNQEPDRGEHSPLLVSRIARICSLTSESTFENQTMKKLTFAAVLVAATLALAGCGGGSSTATDPVDPGPTPDQIEAMALMAAQTAAATAATNAETAAGMAMTDIAAIIALDGEDHERVTTAQSVAADAQAAATRARTASDNAAAATTSAAAEAFQTTAEAEATTAANLRMSVANLLTMAQNAEATRIADAMTAAVTKKAETKETAIMTELIRRRTLTLVSGVVTM